MDLSRTRKETIEKAKDLEDQIEKIEIFMNFLKRKDYMFNTSDEDVSIQKKQPQKRTIFSFFYRYQISPQKYLSEHIEIPEKMRIEILSLCKKWITQLDKEANNNLRLPLDDMRMEYSSYFNEVTSVLTKECIIESFNIPDKSLISDVVEIWNYNQDLECLEEGGKLYNYLKNSDECSEDEKNVIINNIYDFFKNEVN